MQIPQKAVTVGDYHSFFQCHSLETGKYCLHSRKMMRKESLFDEVVAGELVGHLHQFKCYGQFFFDKILCH